jgi:hypothetical protein
VENNSVENKNTEYNYVENDIAVNSNNNEIKNGDDTEYNDFNDRTSGEVSSTGESKRAAKKDSISNESLNQKRILLDYFNDNKLLELIFLEFRRFLSDDSKLDYSTFEDLLYGRYGKGGIKLVPQKYGAKLIFIAFYLLKKYQIVNDNYHHILARQEVISTEQDSELFYNSNTIMSGFKSRWDFEKDELIPLKTDASKFQLQIKKIKNYLKNWKQDS